MSATQPEDDDDSTRLDTAVNSLAEVAAGIARTEPADVVHSLARLFRGFRGGHFFGQVKAEWDRLRSKGRIRDDYLRTEQGKACLQELLDSLDQPGTDLSKFTALKEIFLTAATESMSDRDSVLPQQYMALCRQLTSGEVLVLNATWQLAQDGKSPKEHVGAAEWLKSVATKGGLVHAELAAIHEDGLIEKRLLTPRLYSDRSGVSIGANNRLSNLGVDLCKFIRGDATNHAI